MTLINDVKKALRNTGIEMDADDIAETLSIQPRHRRRVTHAQTAHALQALCASDPDIIRTRPGLYQYLQHHNLQGEPQHPPGPTVRPTPQLTPVAAPSAAHPHPPVRLRPDPAETPILVVAETGYLRDRLAPPPESSTPQFEREAVSETLIQMAQLRLNRSAQLTWQPSPVAAAAALTRHQYSGRDVIVLASLGVIHEAARNAQHTGRPIRIWTIDTIQDEPTPPTGPEITETLRLHPDQIRRTRQSLFAEPATIPRPPSIAPPRRPTPLTTTPEPQHAATSTRPWARLDSLWHLDDGLYRRPIDGITGGGNVHALKRQALFVGETYARRWTIVVNDETREQLTTLNDQLSVPGRLYGDLLTFAETYQLPLHNSHLIKDHLRRGFWRAIRDNQQTDSRPGHAA